MNSPRPKARTTVRDIAQRLGISHTTVSRALRDDPRFTEILRKKVQETAKEMGYRPDPMLSALAQYRLGRTRKAISAALAWVNCWPEPQLLRTYKEFDLYWQGASAEAEQAGYRLEPFHCPAEIPPRRLAQVLRARGIRGLLLTPGWAGGTPDWGDFPWEEFCVLRFGYSLSSPQTHVVTSDQLMDGMLAFDSMWSRGYRRIALVMNENRTSRVVRFSAGYLYAQLKVEPELRLPPFGLAEVYDEPELQRFSAWLKSTRPDAILTEVPAMHRMLPAAGYRVPRDIGLAALSVLDGGADAGINQHSEEIGSAAIQLLLSLIQHNERGIPEIPREVIIPGRWVDGTTLPSRK